MDFTHFSSNYLEARDKFRAASQSAKIYDCLFLTCIENGANEIYDKGVHHEPKEVKRRGIQGEELTIDIAVFGNVQNPRFIQIHSSGLHGVEGYAGSAIQLHLLKEKLHELNQGSSKKQGPNGVDVDGEQHDGVNSEGDDGGDTCIIFVHGLNPYGMSYHRRWNENNVDLNRNFFYSELHNTRQCLTVQSPYEKRGTSTGYDQLDSIINVKLSNMGMFDGVSFYTKAAAVTYRAGFSNVKQALAEGQNKYPCGLFYGGNRLEQGPRLFMEWLERFLSNSDMKSVEKCIHIDIHTGLGTFGEDTLLFGSNHASEVPLLNQAFGSDRVSISQKENLAYEIVGGIEHGLGDLFAARNIKYYGICQEYGTYNGVSVVKALRWENAAWQELGERMSVDHEAKKNVLKTFYVMDDLQWKTKVLTRGQIVFIQSLRMLTTPNN